MTTPALFVCVAIQPSTTATINKKFNVITTFGELATLDSADYDDVPSSDMLG